MTEISRAPDSDLIKWFLEGNDQQSFELLVKRYQDRVYNYCWRFLGNSEDAKDCAQEVFISMYKGLEGFRFEAAFSSWLYRIVINTCKAMIRSKSYRRKNKGIRLEDVAGNDMAFDESGIQPDEVLRRKEINEAFQEALMKLKITYRTLIILRDVEGRKYTEIASLTGIKEGSVKSGLARARHRLALDLKEYSYVV